MRAREARGAGRWGLPFVVRGARLPRGLFADAAAAQASLRRALAPFGLERVSAAAPLWLAWASDVTVAVDARLDVHDGAGSYDEAAAAGVVAAPAALALEGTTESTRREAPGVAEREGPCAALCPGG